MASGTTFETRFCTQCGTALPVEELARFGDRYVCPNCKDTFTQQLREGVVPAAEGQFAGFWIRVAATLIDAAILIPVNLVLQMLLVPAAAVDVEGNPAGFLGAMALANLLGFVLGASYEGFLIHQYGATVGKMALKLKVMRPDGGGISLGRSFGRYFGKMLSSVILGIGYFMVGFDREKRGLHDMIVDTRVVRRS